MRDKVDSPLIFAEQCLLNDWRVRPPALDQVRELGIRADHRDSDPVGSDRRLGHQWQRACHRRFRHGKHRCGCVLLHSVVAQAVRAQPVVRAHLARAFTFERLDDVQRRSGQGVGLRN